ncbi:MAG: hypothetical protein KDA97_08755 [Acidimicrobiales bacterium]|nr:hypothetical protein [Acidimicrobiales bacterium]
MCTTCTTMFDVAATNAVLGAALISNRWVRVRDRFRGIGRLERDVRTWEENAAFVQTMGLDPLTTLGAPPAPPLAEADDVAGPLSAAPAAR